MNQNPETTMAERFFILTPTPTDKTETIESGTTFPVYLDATGMPMKWSGDFPIPPVGSKVWVKMNSIGWAVVKGYFESHGYVGLMTLPTKPPTWLRKQMKNDLAEESRGETKLAPWMREGIGCEFGNELSLKRPAKKTPAVTGA